MADNSIDAELAALHVVMSNWNLHARTADGGLVLPSVYFEEDEDENEQTEKLEVELEGTMEENEDLKKQGERGKLRVDFVICFWRLCNHIVHCRC